MTISLPKIQYFKATGDHSFMPHFNDIYHTHLYCHSGELTFEFNNKKLVCHQGEFLFWFSNSNLKNIAFSKDFLADVLLVENDYLIDNVPDQSKSLDSILYSRIYPIKTIGNSNEKNKILSNFNKLYDRFLENEHKYYDEVLLLQFKIFVYDIWDIFAKYYKNRNQSVKTTQYILEFMKLLQENILIHREVRFYSDLLNISEPHLNFLCKKNTDISASKWIQRFAKEKIFYLLNNTDMSISDIAYDMNFSSTAYFSMYVKKLFGISPSQVRKNDLPIEDVRKSI